jgi:hypothetical protein
MNAALPLDVHAYVVGLHSGRAGRNVKIMESKELLDASSEGEVYRDMRTKVRQQLIRWVTQVLFVAMRCRERGLIAGNGTPCTGQAGLRPDGPFV